MILLGCCTLTMLRRLLEILASLPTRMPRSATRNLHIRTSRTFRINSSRPFDFRAVGRLERDSDASSLRNATLRSDALSGQHVGRWGIFVYKSVLFPPSYVLGRSVQKMINWWNAGGSIEVSPLIPNPETRAYPGALSCRADWGTMPTLYTNNGRSEYRSERLPRSTSHVTVGLAKRRSRRPQAVSMR